MAPGSSPRVRGTETSGSHCCYLYRFIPACAGNSSSSGVGISSPSVHPRVCGEQRQQVRQAGAGDGSSPRVRGTVALLRFSRHTRRFIPACAGNRQPTFSPASHVSVHPRVCGEQSCDLSVQCCVHGSSPRVRGTDQKRTPLAGPDRFIPACAGNSGAILRL